MIENHTIVTPPLLLDGGPPSELQLAQGRCSLAQTRQLYQQYQA